MTETIPVVPKVDVPSKWDIIPIHASDVAAFKRCRRYWDWSSPTRTNLRRRTDINGVNMALWYGSGIHYALEMMYDPILPRDPVEAFKTWYEYQWNGGIVSEDWLERSYDANPQQGIYCPDCNSSGVTGPELQTCNRCNGMGDSVTEYRVKGLKEILPDPIVEEFEEHYDLGIGMLEFYKAYAAKNDHFVVISAENKFSVPLGFMAKDFRKDSPNYGQMLEVHARGTRDAIIYNPDTERYGFMDHKTHGDEITPEYFTKLEMDEQIGTYFWASQHEAAIHDLPYKRIDRAIYNVLRKKYPKPPTVLKDGISPSIDRKNESTTAELFAKHIKDNGIQQLYESDTKWQAYYNWLNEQGDAIYIQRRGITRNASQIKAIATHYRMVAEEMLSETLKIYPTPSSNWLCTKCQFRAPCLAADDGSDFVHMLFDGYEQNRGR